MRKITKEVKDLLALDEHETSQLGLMMALELMAEKLDSIEEYHNQPVPDTGRKVEA